MYKAIQNKKHYLAINRFRNTSKSISDVYLSGFHKWSSYEMKTYSIVIGTFRIMFGIKTKDNGCCQG